MKKKNTTYRLNKVDYSIFIIFSIAAASMLYLFYRDMNSFTIKQAEAPIAKIYFKKNTAQRKFLNNDIWEVLTNSSDIYDGDRIRTSKDSEAYTEFLDSHIQIQLREKSMVQIFKNKKQRSVDFIGGEIFVANNSTEEKLVIHSGKKEIAIDKASEVKIVVPQVPEAVVTGEQEAQDSTVLVEVVSGQAEISEIQTVGKAKVEEEPKVLTAGETYTEMAVISETETPVLPTVPVKTGITKTVDEKSALFWRSDWWNEEKKKSEYNYGFNILTADVTEKYKMIPKGALVEIEISGIPNNDLMGLAIQISTGKPELWERAHDYKEIFVNNGRGLVKDEPFVLKQQIRLKKAVENTDNSIINICYSHNYLDSQLLIKDLKLKLKVVSLNESEKLKPLEKGYKKSIEYKNITLLKDNWGDNPEDYDYRIKVNIDEIIGPEVYFPAGTKIKISVNGKCSQNFGWSFPEIISNINDNWIMLILDPETEDYYQLRFNDVYDEPGTFFDYKKEYECYYPMENSSYGYFTFSLNKEGVQSAPTFTDLKITFEFN